MALTGGAINNGTLIKNSGSFDLQSGSASAILDGSAGASKTTGGTVTLSGANTYTGGTTVSAGALQLGNDTAAGTNTITLAGGTLANSANGVQLIPMPSM